jgi:hypothetical protein
LSADVVACIHTLWWQMSGSDEPVAAWEGVDEVGAPVLARTPDLQRLLTYWHEKRGGRSFPARADIDPLDLGFMLDRIALVEVHDQVTRRFRLRLVGTWWTRKYDFEPTGSWLEDWPSTAQKNLTLASYEKLLVLRRPLILQRNEWLDGATLYYEAALLPLSDDGARISMILAGIGG